MMVQMVDANGKEAGDVESTRVGKVVGDEIRWLVIFVVDKT